MKVQCPHCQAELECLEEHRGMKANCGSCGGKFIVPDAAAPTFPALGNLDAGELLARGLNSVPTPDPSDWEPPTPEELSRLLPQYQIEALIGRGGMGVVYKGRQERLGRAVAIKLLPAELAEDPNFVARFEREARTLAKLDHPGIIHVYDFGQTSEGHLYFVMEFVDGTDLHQMIRGPGLNPPQALEIISQVCDALQFAHSQGVVHRDIKPANILVTTNGRVKLADFGLARPLHAGTSGQLTLSRVVMGTPDYMAPEQKRGEGDHRVDLYALGVMLYEMLCGRTPQGAWQPPSQRVQVDVRLDSVVIKAMQEEPERRYQQACQVKSDVEAIRTSILEKPEVAAEKPPVAKAPVAPPKPQAARPAKNTSRKPLALVAACLVPLLGLGVWLVTREREAIPSVESQQAPASAPTSGAIPPAGEAATNAWIHPQLPPPDADGWITIFDGKTLYGTKVNGMLLKGNSIRLEDDTLRIHWTQLRFPLPHSDVVIRFTGRVTQGQNMNFKVRRNEEEKQSYGCWFTGDRDGQAAIFINEPDQRVLQEAEGTFKNGDFFDAEFRVIGNTLTLLRGGQVIASTIDTKISGGKEIQIGTKQSTAWFKRIEIKVLKP